MFLTLKQDTIDPCLFRRHPNTDRQVWLNLLITVPFPWVLVCTTFVCVNVCVCVCVCVPSKCLYFIQSMEVL